MKNIITLSIIYLLTISYVLGQENELLINKSSEGYQLSWQPTAVLDWVEGMENGYIVERQEDGKSYERLNQTVLKPAVLEGEAPINRIDSMILNFWRSPDTIQVFKRTEEGMQEIEKFHSFYMMRLFSVEGAIDRSGNFYHDKTAEKGKNYQYRVRAADGDYSVSKSSTELYKRNHLVNPEIEIQNKDIEFSWTSSQYDYVLVRKSEQGAMQDYSTTLIAPRYDESSESFSYLFDEELKELESILYFQFVVIDPFGNLVISDIKEVTGKDTSPPNPAKLDKIETNIGSNKVTLRWTKSDLEPDIKGHNIYRSIYADSLFQKINKELLAPTDSFYEDEYTGSETWLYYYIESIDIEGNASKSLVQLAILKGDGAPNVPSGLTATIDKEGVVLISWTANQEEDLLGFRLSGSRDVEAQFIPVVHDVVRTTQFTDTLALNFFNKKYYYKVAALDSSFNHSEYSLPVEIILPDTIRPVQPIIERLNQAGMAVHMNWRLGTDEDIATTMIWQRRAGDQKWAVLDSLPGNKVVTYNHESKPGNYEYAIQTVDEAGNFSDKSNTRHIEIKTPKSKDLISGLKYKKVNKTTVKISFDLDEKQDQYTYHLFRTNAATNKSKLISSVDKTVITDDELIEDTQYIYHILPEDNKGRFLPQSESIEVKL